MKNRVNARRISMLIILIIGIILLILMILSPDFFGVKSKKEVKEIKSTSREENKVTGEKPTITLVGREEITIVKNGVYEEKGATASDNIDGDLTDKIKIKGEIDTSKVGDYELVYEVENSSKIKAQIKRTVKIMDVVDPNIDGIPVLMYHYFYDDTINETGKDSNYLAKSKFEEQIKYLKENDYYFPSMKEISLYVDGKLSLPKKSVVITIDDGEESSYTIAYPLAVEYKVPMVMFVVTSWTDPNMEYQKSMIDTGYIIMQSHTHDMHRGGCSINHGALIQCINYDEGVADLKKSSEMLGSSDSVAYPCGDYNENAINILKGANYLLGFTTEYGKVKVGDNRYALPRVRINGGINLSSFINSL